jgi:hypothetical protein
LRRLAKFKRGQEGVAAPPCLNVVLLLVAPPAVNCHRTCFFNVIVCISTTLFSYSF